EYCKRPLHGKVALVDDEWSTVGSSNLDPLSLSLNLEANVVIRDRAFNAHLRERLEYLMEHACTQVTAERLPRRNAWHIVRSFFVFHFLRRYPAWAGWLPAHVPRVVVPKADPDEASIANLAGMTHATETADR
ncbi:MAG: phospholipase D-like domain-containing protein, partial [Rhizobacter sp.]